MQSSSPSFLSPHSADATLKRLQIRVLQFITAFIFLGSAAITIALIASGESLTSDQAVIPPMATVVFALLFILVSLDKFTNVIGIFSIIYLLFTGISLFLALEDISFLYLELTILYIAVALISNRPIFRAFTLLLIAIILWGPYQIEMLNEAGVPEVNPIAILLLTVLGVVPLAVGLMSRYFVSEIVRNATDAQRSVNLLSASVDIGNDVSQMLDLTILLDRAVEVIRDRFAFYHVSVFLIDNDEKYAMLTASTGDVGERMLSRGHRLPVDSNSVVGRAAQSQEVIIARDTDGEGGHSFNELLPFTRSELAIPIMDKDGIVGVLDIQSRRPDAFIDIEIEALRVITNQLTTAIRNARLFEDKERSIRENKRLFIEAETNLREIQRLNRQLTRQAWVDYLKTDRRIDGVTLSDNAFQNNADWSDAMIDASRRRRAITEEKEGKRKIAVPIELRGEVVGAIELETTPSNKKDDLVDMVRTVSSRLAVSLDNARLFEESNEATAQEQRVSEIVSQYQSAESVDELLRVTLQGLAETLGAEQASIRLGAVPNITDITEVDTDPQMPVLPDENGGNQHDS